MSASYIISTMFTSFLKFVMARLNIFDDLAKCLFKYICKIYAILGRHLKCNYIIAKLIQNQIRYYCHEKLTYCQIKYNKIVQVALHFNHPKHQVWFIHTFMSDTYIRTYL